MKSLSKVRADRSVIIGMGAILALALVVGACVSTTPTTYPSVAMFSEASDLAVLSGTWSGRYWSAASGRSGRVSFSLEARGEAHGEVIMVPKSRMDDDRDALPNATSSRTAERISIRFVRTTSGGIEGATEAYDDPECGCRVRTRFIGTRHGDAIEGTYRSEGALTHVSHSGYWQVERRAETG